MKRAPSSFFQTNLWELLQAGKVSGLVVCGMMAHRCINATVRAAKDDGIPVTLLYGACAAGDLKIMERSVSSRAVQDAYRAAPDGMFAEIRLTGRLEL